MLGPPGEMDQTAYVRGVVKGMLFLQGELHMNTWFTLTELCALRHPRSASYLYWAMHDLEWELW